jgi:hypothetical protein
MFSFGFDEDGRRKVRKAPIREPPAATYPEANRGIRL